MQVRALVAGHCHVVGMGPLENEAVRDRTGPSGAGHLPPDEKCPGTEHPMTRRSHEMATVSEQIIHSSVERLEPLRLVSGFETPHLSPLLTGRLMRHLRFIAPVSDARITGQIGDFCIRTFALSLPKTRAH